MIAAGVGLLAFAIGFVSGFFSNSAPSPHEAEALQEKANLQDSAELPEGTLQEFKDFVRNHEDDLKNRVSNSYKELLENAVFKKILEGNEFDDLINKRLKNEIVDENTLQGNDLGGFEFAIIIELILKIVPMIIEFFKNMKFIKEHNTKLRNNDFGEDGKEITFSLGINQFSDLSVDEFKSLVIGEKGLNITETDPNAEIINPTDVALLGSCPSCSSTGRFSHRGKYVTNVKSQGSCGSCWIFAGVGSLEGAICKAHKNIDCSTWGGLSEQHFLNCLSGGYGCSGGWSNVVTKEANTEGFCIDHTSYKGYKESSCASTPDKYCKNKVSYGYSSGGTEGLIANLNKRGPMSISYPAGNRHFQSYKKGIYKSYYSRKDHAMTATGYGEVGSEGYIEVKNSWGTRWGDGGYFKASTRSGYTGSIESGAQWVTVSGGSDNNDDNVDECCKTCPKT